MADVSTGEQLGGGVIYSSFSNTKTNLLSDDTKKVYNSSSSRTCAAIVYEFPFSSIPSNAIIRSVTFSTRGMTYYSTASDVAKSVLYFNYVTSMDSSGNHTIIDGESNGIQLAKPVSKYPTKATYTHTISSADDPALVWMNNNLSKVRAGTDFGIRICGVYCELYWVKLEITYTIPYTVTTSVSPSGSGTVTGGGTYIEGSTATLTATPANGYAFTSWSDGDTTNPRTITVNSDISLTANFTAVSLSSIYVGSSVVREVYVGGTKASAVYIGTTRIL